MNLKFSRRLTAFVLFSLPVVLLRSQVLTSQHAFTNSPDGANPRQPVWANGAFYGSTISGGVNGMGTIFKFATNGAGYSMLYQFSGIGADGSSPNNLSVNNGKIYGTTSFGGTNGVGVIFAMNTNGAGFTALHQFGAPSDGYYPQAGLTQVGGTLYGATYAGGTVGGGVIFKIGTNGTGYAILHNFTNSPDGLSPESELLYSNGKLYGTTPYGGKNFGTVFAINTNGTGFTILHNFTNAPDGNFPYGGLVLSGGTLYGACTGGGSNTTGTIFAINPNGTQYRTVHHFDGYQNNADGIIPKATLSAHDPLLYGTASSGGSRGGGTLYQINTNGTGFRVIENFGYTNNSGNDLESGVLLVGNQLWGTTYAGGKNGSGLFYSVQLSPQIIAPPQNLIVTNGSPATFSVTAMDDSVTNYQWFFKANTLLIGQTNSSLTLADATNNNSGAYTVVVGDQFGSVTSGPAQLTVIAYPIITAQPQSLTVTNGNPASFTLAAIGQSPLKFQWFSNSTAHPLLSKTSSTLTFTVASYSVAGKYFCIVANALGKATSNPALLTVVGKPIITQQPTNVLVTNGHPVELSVGVTGVGLLNYQWYFQTNKPIANATNSTLIFTNAVTNLAGVYRVIITNLYGKATSSLATIKVLAAPHLLLLKMNPQNNSITLSFAHVPQTTSRLWATSDLTDSNSWCVIATNVMATNGLWFFTEPKTNQARFYRFTSP